MTLCPRTTFTCLFFIPFYLANNENHEFSHEVLLSIGKYIKMQDVGLECHPKPQTVTQMFAGVINTLFWL